MTESTVPPRDDEHDERDEHGEREPVDDGVPGPDHGGPVSTGNVTVDAVLASMEGLEDRPVSEHVAVFEHAHEQLRAALDGAGDDPHPTGDTPAS